MDLFFCIKGEVIVLWLLIGEPPRPGQRGSFGALFEVPLSEALPSSCLHIFRTGGGRGHGVPHR